jgi:bifunctional DNA-binding transcriptional regulator/antitoxin component of YhaV-PrlF toxin-antitoxin module
MNVCINYIVMHDFTFQKVLSGRRVSIPDILSEKYCIKEGDFVIVEDNDGIKITPAQIIKRSTSTSS